MKERSFVRKINKAENSTVIFFFILIFIILFLQFFTRYILNNSLGWTEEIARALLIILCYVGAIINAREGSEIMLEFTRSRLSPKWSSKLDKFVIKPVSAIIYFWLCGLMAFYFTKSRQYLSSINISKKYIIALISFSFFMMGIHTVVRIIKAFKIKKETNS